MSKPFRRRLSGLDALGARLRDLRTRAGMSQMQLARSIGFNPTHGYKYVLRLEKGLVLNPTLRTVTLVLDACHAEWQDIVDVLPALGPAPVRPPAPPPPVIIPAAPARSLPIPTNRGSKPLREWLRLRRREESRARGRRYWQRVGLAEDRACELLRTGAPARNQRRQYLTFVRRLVSVLDAFSSSRPELLRAELDKALAAAAGQGLDRAMLQRLLDVCLEVGRAT
jgi:transcriptional regulator with XRE-family HTH domain